MLELGAEAEKVHKIYMSHTLSFRILVTWHAHGMLGNYPVMVCNKVDSFYIRHCFLKVRSKQIEEVTFEYSMTNDQAYLPWCPRTTTSIGHVERSPAGVAVVGLDFDNTSGSGEFLILILFWPKMGRFGKVLASSTSRI